MSWWQTLIVVLLTSIVNKLIELFGSRYAQKTEFHKFRRAKVFDEIEILKDEIGVLFELAANWKPSEEKTGSYIRAFENDHELVGKYNKYPPIAQAARDTVHWCKIVADCERKCTDDLIKNKQEMGEKYRMFLTACDDHIKKLV